MKDSIQNLAHELFFNISDKKPTEIDIFFLDQIYFPRIEYEPRMTVYLPIPKRSQGLELIQGCAFPIGEESRKEIFALFLISIFHSALHSKITDFKKYKTWMNDKNKKQAYAVFEFIEDVRIGEMTKKEYPEYEIIINKTKTIFDKINQNNDIKNKSKNNFSEKFVSDTSKQRDEIHKKIISMKYDEENITKIANMLYFTPGILPTKKYSFEDHFSHSKRIETWNQNIEIEIDDKFKKNIEELKTVWFNQQRRKEKIRKKYGGITEDLEFDKIDFAPENIGEYLRLKNATHLFLKKMTSQIKTMPNVMDEGMPEDMGLLQMQAAIQAIAAQNNSIQVFEQDDYQRIEEEWAIVVDTSSSMRLKFDEMKKFAICLGEAANEVNSKNGKWGFFAFNNNFSIIKDHYEKFDQSSKARIGGIEVKGLSFIADAIKLCSRILDKESIERRYIFLITDGKALGTYEADGKMKIAVEEARQKGISIIAIGMPTGITKIFSMCMPYEGLKKTVSKFLMAYTQLTENYM